MASNSAAESLTALADAIRAKTGQTGKLSLEGMRSAVDRMPVGGSAPEWGFLPTAWESGLITEGAWYGDRIPRKAFYTWSTLARIEIPNSVVAIESVAFSACSGLTEIALPDSLEEIGDNAFRDCTKLVEITIPNSVTKIGELVFFRCSNLATATFMGKPETMGTDPFSSCDKLTEINVPWAEGEILGAPWGAVNASVNYNYTGG